MWVIYYVVTGGPDAAKGFRDFNAEYRPFMIFMKPWESIWMVPGTVDPSED